MNQPIDDDDSDDFLDSQLEAVSPPPLSCSDRTSPAIRQAKAEL